MQLQRGSNAPVDASRVMVTTVWSSPVGPQVEVDPSAYLLTSAGRVRGDHDMVFYNQTQAGDGALRAAAAASAVSYEVDLQAVPAGIERIVFCLTVEHAQARGQSFASLSTAAISVRTADGVELISFAPPLAGASEAALIVGELYRRAGEWKFRAVGQGFNGGLGPLARSFGIDVADESTASPPTAAAPSPPVSPIPSSPSPSPITARPVNLSKVTLEKKGQSISLEKRGNSFGELRINLNWSRGGGRGGLFGGGGAKAVDLDLGCLYELKDETRGVVQALGNAFGSFEYEPFIELSGDDRTGDVSEGETLRVNGRMWSKIRRMAVFALIYDGATNWQATNGVVVVEAPDQPPIEVRMTEGRNDMRLCGVVLLENISDTLRVTRIVDYYRNQQYLDKALGFGLRWTQGSKD